MDLHVQDEAVKKLLKQVDTALGTGRAVFKEFGVYMRQVTDNTFIKLRHGGSFRGVTWSYFAPQYTRKTDGVTVPAWGGVPKLHGGGTVQGRKRPSGQFVKEGDSIMQDLGTMRSRAALTMFLGNDKIELGPQGVRYAAEQNAMRPFLFFDVPQDANQLLKIALRHLKKTVT